MEVRDPIHGSIEILPGEKPVLDHPLFQRLRNIKQLGFSELAFPSATHNRYSHSMGAMSLADSAITNILRGTEIGSDLATVDRFRRCLRLATLLHDVGHAPLSHCTESAMPPVESLALRSVSPSPSGRLATHEDYTVKVICESSLAGSLAEANPDIPPRHVAALIDSGVAITDGFFIHQGIDYRPLLSQLVSGELDMDRLDYLLRDSYFSGVDYGRFDHQWLLSKLGFHVTGEGRAHLALDIRAVYAFDDFLIARYHMFLMVYLHHRPIIYEEILKRFFDGLEGEYVVPTDIEALAAVDDHSLMGMLRGSDNEWARRVVQRDPYQLLIERHGRADEVDLRPAAATLSAAGVAHILTDSDGQLSKYAGAASSASPQIFVVDHASFQPLPPRPLEQSTDLFQKYASTRRIARIYVPAEEEAHAAALLTP